ncbi:hypothetical protein LXA47_25375 [Massilia sp. P8910]|uniref:hypothetical protein n=1 Tax=Massilia antarctica TaxID=2765360 RepID=UPI001E346734|nr:hypothetical protein [Massilia antarctica]MCE3606910.1 hypothetical protein [Massilia antarctica]
MKKFLRIIMSPWLLLLCTSSVVIYRAVELGSSYGLSVSEWASWVQSVGSIIALLVAIYVMSRQNAHARRLIVQGDQLAVSRRAAAVHAVVAHADTRLTTAMRLTTEPAPSTQSEIVTLTRSLGHSAEMLRAMQRTVGAIPVHELGSYDMADAIRRMDDTLGVLAETLEAFVSMPAQFHDQSMIQHVNVKVSEFRTAVALFRRGMSQIETGNFS